MFKKMITGALLCSMALSGATSILINATDGTTDEAPAIAFEVDIPTVEPTTYADVLTTEETPAPTAEVEFEPQESSTTVDKSADETETETESEIEQSTTPGLAEESAKSETEQSTEPKEEQSETKEKSTEQSEVELPDVIMPTAPSSDTTETPFKDEDKVLEKDEGSSEEDKLSTDEEENSNGDYSTVEQAPAPAPAVNSAPTSVRSSSWNLTAPNAGPNQQNRTNSTNTPGSMLNYRVGKTETYDPMDPTTWKQGSAPYSGEYYAYSGTNFADASCGVHTLANLFLKTGYAIEGFNAVDAYNWSLANGFGENNNGMPAYAWSTLEEKTDGYLKNAGYYDESSGVSGADWVRQEYEKGNFVVMGTSMSGTPHVIMLDYVDDQGNIVTLDSGGGYQFLTQQDGGHVRYAFSFKVEGIPAYNSPKLWAGEDLRSFKPIRDAKYKHFAQNKKVVASNR